MSAIPTDEPAQDAPPSIDTQHLQQQLHQEVQQPEPTRKRKPDYLFYFFLLSISLPAKAPSVRRACIACHTGKTRCSEVLPCQVRFLPFLPPSSSPFFSRVVSNGAWALLVPIQILMHKINKPTITLQVHLMLAAHIRTLPYFLLQLPRMSNSRPHPPCMQPCKAPQTCLTNNITTTMVPLPALLPLPSVQTNAHVI